MGVNKPAFARDANWITDKNMKFLQVDEALIKRVQKQIEQNRYADNQLALAFIREQSNARKDVAGFILSALFIADRECTGILGLKDAQKIPWFDMLLGIVFIAAPYLGAVGKFVQKLDESTKTSRKFVGEMIKSSNDLKGVVNQYLDAADSNSESLSQASASIGVIGKTMAKVYKDIGTTNAVALVLERDAIINGLSLAEVKKKWVESGNTIENALAIYEKLGQRADAELNLVSKLFLYDMLKAYTKRNVVYEFTVGGRMRWHSAELPEDGNEYGDFTGMTQATRDAIYERFGTEQWAIMNHLGGNNPNRPLITGYRDMVKHWGLKVSNGVHLQN